MTATQSLGVERSMTSEIVGVASNLNRPINKPMVVKNAKKHG